MAECFVAGAGTTFLGLRGRRPSPADARALGRIDPQHVARHKRGRLGAGTTMSRRARRTMRSRGCGGCLASAIGACRRGRQDTARIEPTARTDRRLLIGGRKIERDLSDFGLNELGTCELGFGQPRFRLGYRDMQVVLLYGKASATSTPASAILNCETLPRAAMLSRSRSRAALFCASVRACVTRSSGAATRPG